MSPVKLDLLANELSVVKEKTTYLGFHQTSIYGTLTIRLTIIVLDFQLPYRVSLMSSEHDGKTDTWVPTFSFLQAELKLERTN